MGKFRVRTKFGEGQKLEQGFGESLEAGTGEGQKVKGKMLKVEVKARPGHRLGRERGKVKGSQIGSE